MQIYNVEIKEVYKCIASVQAESEEQALKNVKTLYDAGVLELGSEDITETQYRINR